MTILLPALTIAFAAFCVWLTVRIVNRRKKPGKAFWATATILAALIGYPLSFVPAVHLYARGMLPMDVAVVVYRPIRGMLHEATRGHKRSKYVSLGNERVEIAMGEIIAYFYGPATVKK